MNLDELRTVQSKERRKDSLQHLRDSFYEDVADYVAGLKSDRQEAAAAADDPFSSPEVSRLTDEIETAEEVVEAVYERRVGKVVKLASFAAADMPVEEDGMTTQERDLFEDLVARIEENKTTVLDVLAGTDSAASAASAASDRDAGEPAPANAGPSDRAADAETADGTGAGDGSGVGVGTDAATADSGESESGASGPNGDTPDVLSQAMDDDRELAVGDGTGAGASSGESRSGGGSGADTGTSSDPAAAASDPGGTERDAPPTPPETPDGSGPDGSRSGDGNRGGDGSGNGSGSPGSDPSAGVENADRTTVRITRDVGNILGVDQREYDLAEEDVVTLPSANADPLVERDAAERID